MGASSEHVKLVMSRWCQGVGLCCSWPVCRLPQAEASAIYHCTVMPCYDKKLEASREELTVPETQVGCAWGVGGGCHRLVGHFEISATKCDPRPTTCQGPVSGADLPRPLSHTLTSHHAPWQVYHFTFDCGTAVVQSHSLLRASLLVHHLCVHHLYVCLISHMCDACVSDVCVSPGP